MKKLLDRVGKLIAEGYRLREEWRGLSGRRERDREEANLSRARWLTSCSNFFGVVGLPEYAGRFRALEMGPWGNPCDVLAKLTGVLQSARDEIETGFIFKIKYLLHADLFASIVDQAEELIGTGHRIPSAVLGRIVIERWLRDEAEKAGIEVGEEEKASVVNNQLKNGGVFSTPKWRQVQGLLDVGNSAAHGKTDEFEDADVVRMVEFIRANCS